MKDSNSPTPQEIKQAREQAGLTQTEAAVMVGRTLPTWQRWEYGKPVDMACWENFLAKTKSARKKNSST